jgi:hypothetical protein
MLSPSGKVSTRARKAALRRAAAELFPPGYWDVPGQSADDRRKSLLFAAAHMRFLATSGFRARAHTKEAERLESLANQLKEPTP